MDKANLPVILILLVLLLGAAYVFSMKNVPSDSTDDNNGNDVSNDAGEPQTLTEDGYTLEYQYEGDSSWGYTVSGEMPTPCYDAEVDAIVAESFPEQVTVQLTLTAPDDAVVCVQVTKEFEIEGDFSASEGAAVSFRVEQE